MALFDFLDKDKRAAKRVERNIKRLTNAYMQSEERMKSADLLREDGGEEAIYGLLKRFTVRSSNQVVDEDEKQQIYGMVLDFGEDATPSILKFIRREDAILYALRALSEIEPVDAMVEHLGTILEEIGPDYMKNPERKLHIVQHLNELKHARVIEILTPFSDDHDETIRFTVVGALGERGGPDGYEPIVGRLLTDEDESIRVRERCCEILSAAQYSVGEARREVLGEAVPKGWEVDEQGRIRAAKG